MGVCTSKANRVYNQNIECNNNIITDEILISESDDDILISVSDDDILISDTDETINETIDEPIDETVYEIPEFKNNIEMTIGDTIELISQYNNLHGIIRFIGIVDRLPDIFYGIELNKPLNSDDVIHWRHLSNKMNGISLNQNNGYINNKYYFNSNNNDGLFVRKEQINRILKINYDSPRITINDEIEILKYKCKGKIKYIGKPQFNYANNIYYGIKLYNKYNKYILLNRSQLNHFIINSRYDLLINGYISLDIPLDIIKLIQIYSNNISIRCIEIRNNINDCNNNIYKKYEPFDINDNICGPSITITKSGINTHCGYSEVKICGYYQFRKDWFIDTNHSKFIKKTEYQIFKLNNGSIERIFRTIKCDNKNPLLIDYKSVQMRWRHDIYRNNINNCNHKQIFNHISDLYNLLPCQMKKQLTKYAIQLHGLNIH